MPIREIALLYAPVLAILADREEHSAWEIEDELAKLFKVTKEERGIIYPNSRVPIFRNDVAHALKQLVKDRKIKKVCSGKSPDGSKRGIYSQ